ncbi:MAG: MBL fold metallo-hydrolase [Phycisphaerales bacterium]|nr:MBL fold metallo-hydrolase [Phycisphaerales bacterium]
MPRMEPPTPTTRPERRVAPAQLRVLASGSSGNCSLLRTPEGGAILVDAGLSPRRTRRHLEECGLGLADLQAVLLTHLDSDHFYGGWSSALPADVPILVHRQHAREAARCGLGKDRLRTFEGEFSPAPGVEARAVVTAHDELGTAAFRFECAGGAALGFATDLGRPSEALVRHLAGVDVLAIESNYCPRMQIESDRPAFLKQRVMGGRGHLSNEECAALVEEIGPRSHVVLLHLSRQCNDPALVARMHARRPYSVTITSQFDPTPWIPLEAGPKASPPRPRSVIARSLFDHMVPSPEGGR